jgi:glycosyl transferase family 87
VVVLVAKMAVGRRNPSNLVLLACAGVCVLFYPLVHAVQLNQATLLVTALMGGAWLALDRRRPALAGVIFALALGVKPQLVLVLPLMLWHARRMVVAGLVAAAALAAASVAYAGVPNHVDYVTRVLPSLSRGYAYYANQGFNGFYNRLAPGGDIGFFRQPPGSAAVGAATGLTAIVVLVSSAWLLRRWHARGGPEPPWALAIAWLATTVVSPVAWQHHFAPALFAFVLVARALADEPDLRRSHVPLLAGAAFALMASYFEVRSLRGVPERLLASYVLYGAIVLGAALGLVAESRSSRR